MQTTLLMMFIIKQIEFQAIAMRWLMVMLHMVVVVLDEVKRCFGNRLGVLIIIG